MDVQGQNLQLGTKVRSKGSKNNKFRIIAVSARIQQLLQFIKPKLIENDRLVFYSPESKTMPINYRNFTRRAWSAIVDPIKPDTTPYKVLGHFYHTPVT